MPHQVWLADSCRHFGLAVEEYAGWTTRGASSLSPDGVVCHWTAGPPNATGRPSLSTVVNGRSDLPGPLANVYLDRAGVAVVVAAGVANHAGSGGWHGLAGNSSVLGVEAECSGDGDWTPAQRSTYPRLVAALLSGIGRPVDYACGHSEWTDRKIDVRDWPMPTMRADAAAILAGTGPAPDGRELDMFIAFGPGGAMLLGAGYQKGLTGDEYDRLVAVPGMIVVSVDQRGFDLLGSACTNGVSSPAER